MKFDNPGTVEDVVWNMRLVEQERGGDREILQKFYNGDPPFDEATAEENHVQINRNDLSGTSLLAKARRQWNTAFLGGKRYFAVNTDVGPKARKLEHSSIITTAINKRLKRNPKMREQSRSTGGNVMLYGIGPSTWKDRNSAVPVGLPVCNVLIPSDTDTDFDNLDHFALYSEMTMSQMWASLYGRRRDPGWNVDYCKAQLKWLAKNWVSQPNIAAYQYMPEKIAELIKQDAALFASDIAPKIQLWDFFFREKEDGTGWYRRSILDWGGGINPGQTATIINKTSGRAPDMKAQFVYTSGQRAYANYLSEILHCNFGDLSAYFPSKYHSIRSLGWLLWGPCELQTRFYCQIMENAFLQLKWFFRTANQNDFNRIMMAVFSHIGVIPQGVNMVTANERYNPDPRMIGLAQATNQNLIQDSSASYVQSFERGPTGREMTATETMARVNAVNALVSGMLTLAYDMEAPKYREICRRFCQPWSKDPMVRAARQEIISKGVAPKYLDADQWEIEPEKLVGGGDKTVQMAMVQFLNSIRMNLPPQGQRIVDHLSVFAATDQPQLADVIAPMDQPQISNSAHDAQEATPRLMQSLPFTKRPDMVAEEYVKTWLNDLGLMIQQRQQAGNTATMQDIAGFNNILNNVDEFLQQMAQNAQERDKVRQYKDLANKMRNFVKGFAQRLQQQMMAAAKQNGNGNGEAAAQALKLQGQKQLQDAKTQNLLQSNAVRTAQHQIGFELDQQRKDRETAASIRRKNLEHGVDTHHQAQQNQMDLASQAMQLGQQAAAQEEAATREEEGSD